MRSLQNLMMAGLDFHPGMTMVAEAVVEAVVATGQVDSSFLAFLLF